MMVFAMRANFQFIEAISYTVRLDARCEGQQFTLEGDGTASRTRSTDRVRYNSVRQISLPCARKELVVINILHSVLAGRSTKQAHFCQHTCGTLACM